uniref:NADH-plastoquinone oxidoreductase subunit 4L n=1 Tax=Juncus himalensis TaxID=223667 RepID=UPI001F13ADC3|nr:NADH-plastoquinone oxidoreductase subunit 4L [Juncus himalensis]YP_010291330.1 NADH-plastoquinone oxidoreductase subunit 4L [Juncus himalensis]ULQ66990.1 NADH-plastoquinone oxidoreductase subunit 4L [Juncus himalensis]ULQ66993.1 NADH-plastoquinone oxidoreductase subunit 4L [Juncus himalensis]
MDIPLHTRLSDTNGEAQYSTYISWYFLKKGSMGIDLDQYGIITSRPFYIFSLPGNSNNRNDTN